MSRVEKVTTVCDLPHQVGQPDEPAATFELYSKVAGRYEVDLCEMHSNIIFAPVVANGRKVKLGRK